ncbi:hypothetical protein B0G71_1438 [Paraburkholderia sp. BL27I4N3]|uniref:hypothetical protein n=1 Tax=Paraburkholderia sp. BL27I4N3 TaxID=1938805 RepID=UPI000E247776|nr:hypothetical protein [Paraburkholderia sp. BL27I4N3]REE18422.1 hypothetical protein B0G71_1438 [Paraburkholderia sp. BL27I4N3]
MHTMSLPTFVPRIRPRRFNTVSNRTAGARVPRSPGGAPNSLAWVLQPLALVWARRRRASVMRIVERVSAAPALPRAHIVESRLAMLASEPRASASNPPAQMRRMRDVPDMRDSRPAVLPASAPRAARVHFQQTAHERAMRARDEKIRPQPHGVAPLPPAAGAHRPLLSEAASVTPPSGAKLALRQGTRSWTISRATVKEIATSATSTRSTMWSSRFVPIYRSLSHSATSQSERDIEPRASVQPVGASLPQRAGEIVDLPGFAANGIHYPARRFVPLPDVRMPTRASDTQPSRAPLELARRTSAPELVWRTTAAATRRDDTPAMRESASRAAQHKRASAMPAAPSAALDTPLASVAADARRAQPLPIDTAAIERLANDVMNRIERKMRIERQRRGL